MQHCRMRTPTRVPSDVLRSILQFRTIATFMALVSLVAWGGRLESWVRGSDVIEALQVSALVGLVVTFVYVLGEIGFLIARRRDPSRFAAQFLNPVVVGLGFVLGAFALWLPLYLTASPFALLFAVAARGAIAELMGRALQVSARRDPPIGNPVLEQRLARFAREVGVDGVHVMKLASEGGRPSSLALAPDVMLIGRTVVVPSALIDADPAALELRLAREIVRRRHNVKRWSAIVESVTLLAISGAIVALFAEPLLRFSGADSFAAPAFVPAGVVIYGAARGLNAPVRAWFRRRTDQRLLPEVLDLTRSPEGAIASQEYDIILGRTSKNPGVFERLQDVNVPVQQWTEIIERWRRSRRLCLLFTDVVGSTENLNALGDEGWYEVLSEHDHVLREVAAASGGEEIDKSGDGFLFVFGDVGQGVLAARQMQMQIRAIELAPGQPISVRMGLHAGEVIRRGRELVGREVHLAARVGALAGAGEILVSEGVHRELGSTARFRFGEPRRVVLKGFEGDHLVFPVLTADARPTM